MALSKITYTNKETLNEQPSIADKNKVTDDDMNEIKRVVNDGIDAIEGKITSGTTSNVNYLKFDDGTLVVYGTSNTITFVAQNSSYDTINFPVSFKDTNYAVNLTINSTFSFFTYLYLNPSNRAVGSVKVGGFNEYSSNVSGKVDYIIIGKWK